MTESPLLYEEQLMIMMTMMIIIRTNSTSGFPVAIYQLPHAGLMNYITRCNDMKYPYVHNVERLVVEVVLVEVVVVEV
ncbi:hypothetical protein EYF80_059640 [Liparis tanakae]|uniref:Uncharacterized protein n=1 Tax=Liparis tanakae TaxID=230148 RepID=A0A4Z2EN83_9TELE|nr:hypothetical protein EYF80_059640 [Liparis tanakae]